jgi:Arg-Lys translocation region protein phosphatase
MILIYTEDILIHNPLSKIPECKLPPEIYTSRLLLAISLSIFGGVFLYIFLIRFYKKLHEFYKLILDFGRNNLSDTYLLAPTSYKEINELKTVLRNSIHAFKDREAKNFRALLVESNNIFIDQIHPVIFDIKIQPIKNLDISIVPSNSSNPEIDYTNLIETRNGCIGIIAGFPKTDLIGASYKARFQSMFKMLKELNVHLGEEEILLSIEKTILAHKVSNLNFSLFFVPSHSEKIYYFHYQENPAYLVTTEKLERIPASGEAYYPFLEFSVDLKSVNLPQNGILFHFSDRIRNCKGFEDGKFLTGLEKEIQSKLTAIHNSRDLMILAARFFEGWQRDHGDNHSIYDLLSIIIIRRKKINLI